MSYLPVARFHQLIADAPLISIDLVVVDGQGRMLLGRRRNAPARDTWFVPGGRILKGELLAEAMSRIVAAELGSQARTLVPQWLGLYEHHYPDSAGSPECPTHYVVLAHHVSWPDSFGFHFPETQHACYRWQTLDEVIQATDVHVHSRWYAQDLTGVSRCPRFYP